MRGHRPWRLAAPRRCSGGSWRPGACGRSGSCTRGLATPAGGEAEPAAAARPPPPPPPPPPPQAWRAKLAASWEEMRKQEKVLAICTSTAVLMSGHGVLTPVLPMFAESLGSTAAQLGLSLAAFAVARLVLNVPLGLLSDRYGRRPLLWGGALLCAVGMGGSGLATTVEELLLWRLLAGAGNAAYLGGAQMYLNDICTNENRARVLGAQQSAVLFGVALGPALGGVLGDVGGLVAPFMVVGAAGGVAALYSFVRIPETLPALVGGAAGGAAVAGGALKPKGGGNLAAARLLLADSRFAAAGLMNFNSFALRQGGRNVLLVLYATGVHGFSVGQLGLLFSAMATVDLLLIPAAAAAADAAGPDRRTLVVPSALGCAGALTAIGVGGTDPMVFGGALCLWSLSTAATGPAVAAYAAEIVPPERRGLGTALFRSAGDVGFLAVPLALGAAADAFGSPDLPFLLLAGSTAGCAAAFASAGLPVFPPLPPPPGEQTQKS